PPPNEASGRGSAAQKIDRLDLATGVPPARSLERVRVDFAGADAHRLVDRNDEDLAVADLAGARGAGQRLDHLIGPVARHADFDAEFRQEAHRVLGAAIDFLVALLPAVALHLGDGHAVNPDRVERL